MASNRDDVLTLQHEVLLMQSLSKFYRVTANMDIIIPIIDGNSDVSLRLIDYFVTGYVRRHNVSVTSTLPTGAPVQLNVHLSYRAQLKAYSKQTFDCFRRRDRILFCYAPDKSIETTIGQLNFFRWLITHGVLAYIQENRASIEADMVHVQKPRSSLSPAATVGTDTPDRSLNVTPSLDSDDDPLMKRFTGRTTLTFA